MNFRVFSLFFKCLKMPFCCKLVLPYCIVVVLCGLMQFSISLCNRTLLYHSFVTDLADTRSMSPLLGLTPTPLNYIMSWIVSHHLCQSLWSHGIGRHSREEIYSIAERDLRAVSQVLGTKKFLMGSKPCLLDAAVFGLVSVFLWNVPNSPQAKLIRSELKNVEAHCYTIREEYFPDWDELILKNTNSLDH